jgi:hypothetical protein
VFPPRDPAPAHHHHTIHQTTIACQPYRGICTHQPWATVAASHQTKTSAAKVAQSHQHLHRPRTTRQQQRCRKVAGHWDRAQRAPAVHHPEKPPPKQPRCVPTNSPRSPRKANRGSLNPRGWLRRLGYDCSSLAPQPGLRGPRRVRETQELTMLSPSTRNEPKHHKAARASSASNSMRSARKRNPIL